MINALDYKICGVKIDKNPLGFNHATSTQNATSHILWRSSKSLADIKQILNNIESKILSLSQSLNVDIKFLNPILESNLDSKDLRNMDNASFYSPCIRLENANTTLITKEDSINAGFSSDNRCVSFRTCGVNVDIFVMESYGNDLESARKNIQYMNKFFTYYIRRLMYPGITPNLKNRRFATKILKKIQYFFTYGNNPISNFFINLNKKKADTYLESKYKNITDLQSFVFCAWIDVFFNTKDLQEFIKLSFEGVEFFAPKNYDSILRSNYGDYMQLPPKEKQVAPHGFYYLNLESPYKNCKYNKLITSFVW